MSLKFRIGKRSSSKSESKPEPSSSPEISVYDKNDDVIAQLKKQYGSVISFELRKNPELRTEIRGFLRQNSQGNEHLEKLFSLYENFVEFFNQFRVTKDGDETNSRLAVFNVELKRLGKKVESNRDLLCAFQDSTVVDDIIQRSQQEPSSVDANFFSAIIPKLVDELNEKLIYPYYKTLYFKKWIEAKLQKQIMNDSGML